MDGTFRIDYLTSPFNGFSPSMVDDEDEINPSDMEDLITLEFAEKPLATFEQGFTKRFVTDPDNLYQDAIQETWGTCAVFNALGFYMTQALYMRQMGFFPTFHQEVSDAIGGYPKGAVLRCIMRGGKTRNDLTYEGWIVDVVSMRDNNTKNFVYDETSNPEPYEIGKPDANGIIWWKFITTHTPYSQSSMLPDLVQGKWWTPDNEGWCVTGDSLAFSSTMESLAGNSNQEAIYCDGDVSGSYDVAAMNVNYNSNVMTPALASARYRIYNPPVGLQIIMFPPRNVELEA